MAIEADTKICDCRHPYFVAHSGWWRCRNCDGALPYATREDHIAIMRIQIEEGRAALAKRTRQR